MQLSHDLELNVPLERAWDLLTDLERVIACIPGARLDAAAQGVYQGQLTMQVGAFRCRCSGSTRFLELDADHRRAVLQASGEETARGGTVALTVTAQLRSEGTRTAVSLAGDLELTGELGRFGRDVIYDAGAALLGQLVDLLEIDLAASALDLAARAPSAGAPGSAGPSGAAGTAAGAGAGSGDGTASPPSGAEEALGDALKWLRGASSSACRHLPATKACVALSGLAAVVAVLGRRRAGSSSRCRRAR